MIKIDQTEVEFTYNMAKALVEHFNSHKDDDGVVQIISNDLGVFIVRPSLPKYPMCIGKARLTKRDYSNVKTRH